jgi:hypothetical protein
MRKWIAALASAYGMSRLADRIWPPYPERCTHYECGYGPLVRCRYASAERRSR